MPQPSLPIRYIVSGEGVRDNDWKEVALRSPSPSYLPSSFTVFRVASSPLGGIAPTVRIYPTESQVTYSSSLSEPHAPAQSAPPAPSPHVHSRNLPSRPPPPRTPTQINNVPSLSKRDPPSYVLQPSADEPSAYNDAHQRQRLRSLSGAVFFAAPAPTPPCSPDQAVVSSPIQTAVPHTGPVSSTPPPLPISVVPQHPSSQVSSPSSGPSAIERSLPGATASPTVNVTANSTSSIPPPNSSAASTLSLATPNASSHMDVETPIANSAPRRRFATKKTSPIAEVCVHEQRKAIESILARHRSDKRRPGSSSALSKLPEGLTPLARGSLDPNTAMPSDNASPGGSNLNQERRQLSVHPTASSTSPTAMLNPLPVEGHLPGAGRSSTGMNPRPIFDRCAAVPMPTSTPETIEVPTLSTVAGQQRAVPDASVQNSTRTQGGEEIHQKPASLSKRMMNIPEPLVDHALNSNVRERSGASSRAVRANGQSDRDPPHYYEGSGKITTAREGDIYKQTNVVTEDPLSKRRVNSEADVVMKEIPLSTSGSSSAGVLLSETGSGATLSNRQDTISSMPANLKQDISVRNGKETGMTEKHRGDSGGYVQRIAEIANEHRRGTPRAIGSSTLHDGDEEEHLGDKHGMHEEGRDLQLAANSRSLTDQHRNKSEEMLSFFKRLVSLISVYNDVQPLGGTKGGGRRKFLKDVLDNFTTERGISQTGGKDAVGAQIERTAVVNGNQNSTKTVAVEMGIVSSTGQGDGTRSGKSTGGALETDAPRIRSGLGRRGAIEESRYGTEAASTERGTRVVEEWQARLKVIKAFPRRVNMWIRTEANGSCLQEVAGAVERVCSAIDASKKKTPSESEVPDGDLRNWLVGLHTNVKFMSRLWIATSAEGIFNFVKWSLAVVKWVTERCEVVISRKDVGREQVVNAEDMVLGFLEADDTHSKPEDFIEGWLRKYPSQFFTLLGPMNDSTLRTLGLELQRSIESFHAKARVLSQCANTLGDMRRKASQGMALDTKRKDTAAASGQSGRTNFVAQSAPGRDLEGSRKGDSMVRRIVGQSDGAVGGNRLDDRGRYGGPGIKRKLSSVEISGDMDRSVKQKIGEASSAAATVDLINESSQPTVEQRAGHAKVSVGNKSSHAMNKVGTSSTKNTNEGTVTMGSNGRGRSVSVVVDPGSAVAPGMGSNDKRRSSSEQMAGGRGGLKAHQTLFQLMHRSAADEKEKSKSNVAEISGGRKRGSMHGSCASASSSALSTPQPGKELSTALTPTSARVMSSTHVATGAQKDISNFGGMRVPGTHAAVASVPATNGGILSRRGTGRGGEGGDIDKNVEERAKKRNHPKRRISFSPHVVAGSYPSKNGVEDVESLFNDGFDILGEKSAVQSQAVQERINKMSRGAVFVMYGYVKRYIEAIDRNAQRVESIASDRMLLPYPSSALKRTERSLNMSLPALQGTTSAPPVGGVAAVGGGATGTSSAPLQAVPPMVPPGSAIALRSAPASVVLRSAPVPLPPFSVPPSRIPPSRVPPPQVPPPRSTRGNNL